MSALTLSSSSRRFLPFVPRPSCRLLSFSSRVGALLPEYSSLPRGVTFRGCSSRGWSESDDNRHWRALFWCWMSWTWLLPGPYIGRPPPPHLVGTAGPQLRGGSPRRTFFLLRRKCLRPLLSHRFVPPSQIVSLLHSAFGNSSLDEI